MSTEPGQDSTASGWGIYEIARSQDPYPAWDALRERAPVHDAGDGVFFVSAWELVDRVLRDPTLNAGSGVTESLFVEGGLAADVSRLWLMALDGPPHVRARGLVSRVFSARQVEALRPFIEERADALVSGFLAEARERPADFVPQVALALPSDVIRQLFRIEPEVWRTEVHAQFTPEGAGDTAQLLEALAACFDRVARDAETGLLADLREPDKEGDRLSHEEVVANAVLLATAAIDTTTGLIANALLCLLEHPAVLERVRKDHALVPAVVEETLRYEPPALSCSRYAPQPMELGRVAIPAGSHLLLGIGAANRDPAKYPQPNRFDPGRDHGGLLTFGGGRHFCLGAALARLEAQVVLEALLASGDSLELASPVAWRVGNPTVRVPDALLVRAQRERPA